MDGCVYAGPHPTVGILSPTHALEHSLVEPELQTGLVEHLPLVAVPGDQAVDLDGLGLADTMTPSLGLEDNAFRRSKVVLEGTLQHLKHFSLRSHVSTTRIKKTKNRRQSVIRFVPAGRSEGSSQNQR